MTIAQMATGHNASDAALLMQLSNQTGMSSGTSANAASEANSLSTSMNQDLMDWVASLRPARYIRLARLPIVAVISFWAAAPAGDKVL